MKGEDAILILVMSKLTAVSGRQYDEAVDMAIEALSAERTGWIPVSERLAEFPCIVTDANGNPPFVPLCIATITDKEHGTWQIDGDKVNKKVIIDGEEGTIANWGNRIIAWMPLPEPYKGGDTE